ncbi:hypothetical protein NKH77_00680 [Streptomyces sp. M19]
MRTCQRPRPRRRAFVVGGAEGLIRSGSLGGRCPRRATESAPGLPGRLLARSHSWTALAVDSECSSMIVKWSPGTSTS